MPESPMKNPRIQHGQADLFMAGAVVLILAVLLIPVPNTVLDLLLALSVGISLFVLIFTIELKDSMEFSSFPSLLLLLTLFRLALNVATTRQILLNAYAGHVIDAFGQFVVGGNYVVGIVIFCILVVINFLVITKGSGRVAEVAARFTLDAMPGKQMSIDADLNQGVIDEKQAVKRREKLAQEADFYGAMDGASKFVRGDAVAGILITLINIGAGFIIGVAQKGMTAADALRNYTILTVGDGLVSQIPALIISTSAGILVTRAATNENLGEEVANQLFMNPRQLLVTSGILGGISIVPGLPFLPFILLSGSVGVMGWSLRAKTTQKPDAETKTSANTEAEEATQQGSASPSTPAELKHALAVSPMDLELGFGLVPLVDRNQGGRLIERIGHVRTQIAEELGFVLPPINVRDNVNLKNTDYLIRIRGLDIARGTLRPGSFMAIDPGNQSPLEGYVAVREPAFGFMAYWIPEGKRDFVESKGFTVVDATSVLTTHLASVVRQYGSDLLRRQDVSELIEQVKDSNPAVVEELLPNKIPLGILHRVLQMLLKERVPIKDLAVILETLSDFGGKTQEPSLLTEYCRRALGGHICRTFLAEDGTLRAIGLHPELETMLRDALHRDNAGASVPAIAPDVAQEVLQRLRVAQQTARSQGVEPIVLCSAPVRQPLRRMTQHDLGDLPVVSYAEVPETCPIDMVTIVALPAASELAHAQTGDGG